jgi:uroporphyrinogen decarboxylase
MDSRERVFLTLNHEESDRVPFDFWASDGAWKVIEQGSGLHRNEFLDKYDVDFRYVDGPAYIGPVLAPNTDIWGVKRRVVDVPTPYGKETYSEVDVSPLASAASADEVDDFKGWPSADSYDYSVVKAQARAVRDSGRIVVFMGDRLNRIAQLKPAMYLRGVEQILVDMAVNPDIARAVFGRMKTFYTEYLQRILDAADGLIDIVLTGDDFGQQGGPLVSRDMWDDFIAEGFACYMRVINAYGARSMHHTCGDVRLLVGRMRKLGLNILQSLQPEAMGDFFPELKLKYGREMCFQGGISIQQTMPKGSLADVAAEVKERVKLLGVGGGYFLCTAHNVQADCPYRNITALLDAYRTEGRYSKTH